MARRAFDFTESQKTEIRAQYNFVCAACGADDALHIDHWVAGDSNDAGVCLCYACNLVKGNARIPANLRLAPRNPLDIISHTEYRLQVAANREAFARWVAPHRGTAKLRPLTFAAPH
jgi:hypothetical protein